MAKKPRPSWIEVWSRRMTQGRLTVGNGRRPSRSRRVTAEMQHIATTAAVVRPRTEWGGRYGAWLLAFVTIALILYAMFGTDWFYIYDIDLRGAQRISKEEIYARSQVEALSLFWLNPAAVAADLETEPMIQQAVVSALPPNRVQIYIQERQPVAVWQTAGQSYFADQDGVLFGLRGDASQLVIIKDVTDTPTAPGGHIDPAIIRSAYELNRLIPERYAFDWEPGLGISFLNEHQFRVAFGDYTRMEAKVAAYAAFLQQLPSDQTLTLLDLSMPEHPYYQVAEASVEVAQE